MVKSPPVMQETWVQSLDWEDPPEEGMASILAWRIPMDRGAWWDTIHRLAKSDTTERLSTAQKRECWLNKQYRGIIINSWSTTMVSWLFLRVHFLLEIHIEIYGRNNMIWGIYFKIIQTRRVRRWACWQNRPWVDHCWSYRKGWMEFHYTILSFKKCLKLCVSQSLKSKPRFEEKITIFNVIREKSKWKLEGRGNSLAVQCLGLWASTAGGTGSVPGWGA